MKKARTFLAMAALMVCSGVSLKAQEPDGEAERMEALERRVKELEEMVRELRGRLVESDRQPDSGQVAQTAQKPAVQPLPAPPKPDPSTLRAYWKDGIRLDSADKAFQLKLGGRIHNDWAFYAGDAPLEASVGRLADGVEIRRARLETSGKIYDRLDFKVQFDFAGGGAEARDLYLGIDDVPVLGGVKFGHQKEPFGLEEITSSNSTTFLERSVANTFSPSRNTGVLAQRTMASERLNWSAGVFRDTDPTGFARGDGGYNFTGRLTGLPWYSEGGRKLVHLGVAYSRQNFPSDVLRYRERPESHLAPRFVDTGSLAARSADLLGLEAALVSGPFSLQGEYARSFVNTPSGSDPSFMGFYVQGSFFLTGEHRVYKTSSAAFDSTRPRANFGGEGGGKGAWELAARYSHLDLNDVGIAGGRLNDFTFGVNWYLNPNTRFMWNYVLSDLDSTGQAHILQTRVQVHF